MSPRGTQAGDPGAPAGYMTQGEPLGAPLRHLQAVPMAGLPTDMEELWAPDAPGSGETSAAPTRLAGGAQRHGARRSQKPLRNSARSHIPQARPS